MKELSLVMIVKNEEAYLPRCLSSVKGLVSEIIIADTGSTDRTIEVAKEYGARVIRLGWESDFSKARNLALTQVDSDFILHLDADEYLSLESVNSIRNLDIENFDVFNLDLIEENGEFLAHYPRVFRRSSFVGYKGRIHEYPDFFPDTRVSNTSIVITHSGYSNFAIASKDKANRNLDMLALALIDNPDDPQTNFLYARELDRRLDKNAELYYRKAFDRKDEIGSTEVCKFFATFMAKNGKTRKALDIVERGLVGDPYSSELRYLSGLIYTDLKEYDEALDAFSCCLNQRGQAGRRAIEQNLIWRGIGMALKEKGDIRSSVKAFTRAVKLDINDEFSRHQLRVLLASFMSEKQVSLFFDDI